MGGGGRRLDPRSFPLKAPGEGVARPGAFLGRRRGLKVSRPVLKLEAVLFPWSGDGELGLQPGRLSAARTSRIPDLPGPTCNLSYGPRMGLEDETQGGDAGQVDPSPKGIVGEMGGSPEWLGRGRRRGSAHQSLSGAKLTLRGGLVANV